MGKRDKGEEEGRGRQGRKIDWEGWSLLRDWTNTCLLCFVWKKALSWVLHSPSLLFSHLPPTPFKISQIKTRSDRRKLSFGVKWSGFESQLLPLVSCVFLNGMRLWLYFFSHVKQGYKYCQWDNAGTQYISTNSHNNWWTKLITLNILT